MYAQDFRTKLEGRVYSENGDVAATHISNISTNKGTIADANGFFIISVRYNDTLVFSAVQFKRREIIITNKILQSKFLVVALEESLTVLDEVVIMPYSLTGNLNNDTKSLQISNIKTASTEGLPNANVIPKTQSQRKLYTARTWDYRIVAVRLDPLMNYFSGRTKMLNERVKREVKTNLIYEIRQYFNDSLYIIDLKIPENKINNFLYFCEVDSNFTPIAFTKDKLKLWDFFKNKSAVFRKNNDLE